MLIGLLRNPAVFKERLAVEATPTGYEKENRMPATQYTHTKGKKL